MKTIKNEIEKTLIIKNSKFICTLKKVNTLEDISLSLKEIKEKYPNATHYCYAYILNNLEKCSDDNEPQGTASLPILNVLKKNDLNHILAVVTRYFGGIKLGASGLVRAYSLSVTNAIDNNIKDIIKGKNIDIFFDYNLQKQIDYLLKEEEITNKDFTNQVKYNINIKEDTLEKLKELNINITINKDIYI